MAKTILIVEDTPVSLKLSAVVLRSEGYRVHIASTAEQALLTLKTVRPDLMLVDIRLPGMSGLELTNRVKQDASLKNVIVIALTALNTEEDKRRAREAGCDGYLTKPIDTRTLADSIRQYLERGVVPDEDTVGSEPVTEVPCVGLALPEPVIEDLRRTFLADGVSESVRLQAAPRLQLDTPQAGQRLLQWVATAGVLGLSGISRRAKEAGALLDDPSATADQIHVALTNLARAFAEAAAHENPAAALPDAAMQKLAGKRVALVALGEREAELLCGALERAGARPRLFDGHEPPSSEAVCGCPVAVVHVRPETSDLPWLQPDFIPPPETAVILIGRRQHIFSLDPRVPAGASDFLIDFWQPDEALLRIYLALLRASGSSAGLREP